MRAGRRRVPSPARIKYGALASSLEGGTPAAIDILADLLGYFQGFGPAGLLAFLFTVLCLDAMLVPTLPEFFVMAFYTARPSFEWGVTLLVVVVVAELAGNGIVFTLVRRFGMPKFLKRKMEQWTGLLVVKDERIILVNRVAPILPFAGAFIAVMKWDVRRAFLYIFVGGAIKYALLIAFAGVISIVYPPATARNVTLAAIILLVAVSIVQGQLAKKKHMGPVATRVAHLGEGSSAAPLAPGGGKGEGAAGDREQGKEQEKGQG